MRIINGENCVLGRLSSVVAKELINGEEIHVINCEQIVIIGDPLTTTKRHAKRLIIRNPAKPIKSSYFSRKPDFVVRKTIKGMLPHTKKGAIVYKNLRVYIGTPKELEGKGEKIAELKNQYKKKITILELCKNLGWKG